MTSQQFEEALLNAKDGDILKWHGHKVTIAHRNGHCLNPLMNEDAWDEETDSNVEEEYIPDHYYKDDSFVPLRLSDYEELTDVIYINFPSFTIIAAHVDNISCLHYDKEVYEKLVPLWVAGICKRYGPTSPVYTEEDFWCGLFDPTSCSDVAYDCLKYGGQV